MKAYRIKNADTLFETYETGKLKNLLWVPVPNRHDGKGYRRLLRLQDGPLLYAAWIAMLLVASKCKPRWILVDGDGPLTADDLSVKTDIPASAFDSAFKALITRDIGWIERVEISADLLEVQQIPADDAAIPARREGKGIEGNRREGKEPKRGALADVTDGAIGQVVEIFEYWQAVHGHPDSKLTAARDKKVRARLADGYGVDRIKLAIDGCKLDPFSMGANDTGKTWDDLDLICRDGGHIERFIGYVTNPPRPPGNGANGHKPLTHEESIQNGVRLVAKYRAEEQAERERNGEQSGHN